MMLVIMHNASSMMGTFMIIMMIIMMGIMLFSFLFFRKKRGKSRLAMKFKLQQMRQRLFVSHYRQEQ